MDDLLGLLKSPNRPELYLLLALSAMTGALLHLYREVRKRDQEAIDELKERIDENDKTISILSSLAEAKVAAAGRRSGREVCGVRDPVVAGSDEK